MTENQSNADFNATDYLGLMWRRRKLFVVPFVLVTALGIGIGSLIPKGYESKTVTKVVERSYLDRLYKGLDVAPPPTIELNTAKFTFKSKELLAEILDEQKMLAHCRTESDRQEAIEKVAERIKVDVMSPKVGGGDKLLMISFTAPNPGQAQILVKSITEKNISRLKMRYRGNMRDTRDKAVQEHQSSLTSYEETIDRLQEFEEHNIRMLLGGDESFVELSVERDKEKLSELINTILKLRGRIEQLDLSLTNLDQEIVTYDRVENPSYAQVASAEQNLRELVDELESTRHGDHPMVRQKRAEWQKAKEQLDQTPRWLKNEEVRKPNPRWEETDIDLRTAIADREHNMLAKNTLMERIREHQERVDQLPSIRKEHKELLSRADRSSEALKDFEKKLRQARISYERVKNSLDQIFVTVEHASKPLRHSTPPQELILLISIALGAAAGLGTVVLREMGRRTFYSSDDVAASLPWPVIGVVYTILSRDEHAHRTRKRAAVVVAGLILVVGVSTVVYVYNRSPELLPDFLVDSVQKVRELI